MCLQRKRTHSHLTASTEITQTKLNITMEGKPLYQSNDVAIAPFLMLYFKEPAPTFPTQIEQNINAFSYFKNEQDMSFGRMLTPSQLRAKFLQTKEKPSKFSSIIIVDESALCYPGHLPIFEDLIAYSEVFHLTLKNQIDILGKQGDACTKIIPDNLCEVIYPRPQLDFESPVFTLGNLPVRMSFASYSDAFQVNQFYSNIQVVVINVFHGLLQEERKNGLLVKKMKRYHDVRIDPVYFHRYCVKPLPLRKGTRIIVWNVRGASRPSFPKKFSKLCATYKPQVVILTETRISKSNMAWVMYQLGSNWGHVMFGESDENGGPVVFIYNKLTVKILDFLYENEPWIASVRIQGVPWTETEKQYFV